MEMRSAPHPTGMFSVGATRPLPHRSLPRRQRVERVGRVPRRHRRRGMTCGFEVSTPNICSQPVICPRYRRVSRFRQALCRWLRRSTGIRRTALMSRICRNRANMLRVVPAIPPESCCCPAPDCSRHRPALQPAARGVSLGEIEASRFELFERPGRPAPRTVQGRIRADTHQRSENRTPMPCSAPVLSFALSRRVASSESSSEPGPAPARMSRQPSR